MRNRKISLWLILLAAKIAARHEVPERWSLSQDKFKYPNFSHFLLFDAKLEDFRFLNKVKPKNRYYEGIAWDGDSRTGLPACLDSERLLEPTLSVQRIYKAVSIQYTNPVSFILGEIIQAHVWKNARENMRQRRFKRSVQLVADRIEVLGRVVAWRRELVMNGKAQSFDGSFSHIDLLGYFYSNRIWLLENHEHYLKELQFLLDSLVASGDLRRADHRYALDGKSLTTLATAEEDRKRHLSGQRHNASIRGLTWILALAAMIQLVVNFLPKAQ